MLSFRYDLVLKRMCQKAAQDAGTLADQNKIEDRFQKMVSRRVLDLEYSLKMIKVQEKKDSGDRSSLTPTHRNSFIYVLVTFLYR